MKGQRILRIGYLLVDLGFFFCSVPKFCGTLDAFYNNTVAFIHGLKYSLWLICILYPS